MSKKRLQSFEEMFGEEILDNESSVEESITEISLKDLLPFKNHPFKLYEGERLDDMIKSIEDLGVIVPVIVRPINNNQYEILSGHNRVNAANIAGLEKVPAVIKEDLTDEEAFLIVTETNLIQRSFADLSHSERASVIASRHEAMKNQGVRNDLFNEIEKLLEADEIKDCETCAPMGNKLKTIDKVGKEYNLSKNSIARYLRIAKLIKPFQELMDENQISIRAGVDLSYLNNEEQYLVHSVISEIENANIDMKKAALIRSEAKKDELTKDTVLDIIKGKVEKKKKGRPSHFKLKNNIVSKFFTKEQKPKEIEDVIEKALTLYFQQERD
ncbi:chromosome partitioning protein ParB [Vallitalea longa]|uniref:Chromosome partitioning protein ParB n=1 Tax=Vallitalea longa TaxID=2936439 RepID=A0A9W5YCE2_9FIRM|nr:ParB/RepB/Spo0J family partition protein [Vallitalea longa]GKX31402.1 chromosome partitioning protein ParB [Vallitalea longa]